MSLLEIRGLRSGYGDITVLRGVSIVVEAGQIVTLVGSNGAGKTTLLRTVSGLIRPMSGEILYDGQAIQCLPPHQVVAKGIVQVPEGRQLFPALSVQDNLRVGSYVPEARRRRQETIEEVFSLFPRLRERQQQRAGTLSGGEQQMLAVARALMARPKLLMMDEPSWGLAPILVNDLFEAIKRIQQTGTTVLLVEQNVYRALSIADQAYVLERGSITMDGTGPELLAREDLRAAYLGL